MMKNIAIKVDDVSKMYKLYEKPSDRFKEALGLSRKKRYTEHYALNHVSFEVKTGETVGIIGTNGAGKSTILKIITGVLHPTEGEVIVNGRISALLELGAGFNSEYTGIENIYLNGTMMGFTREEIDAKVQDIVDFADIGNFVNQPVKTYSSGMFVRLAFAIAINIDPEILIVDEALSVGDVFFQTKCYKKFEEFKKLGKTILFVSHDLGSIIKYCDRVVLLNKGSYVAEGNAGEMVDLYKKILANQYEESEPEEIGEQEQQGVIKDKKAVADGELWKNLLGLNGQKNEYGNKRAEIIDFGVFDRNNQISNVVKKGEEFTIKMRILFHDNVKEPIFAYTLKDKKGTEITGTNTFIEDCGVIGAQREQVYEVTFRQKAIMQGGEYLLSFGCTQYGVNELEVLHRLYDVTYLTVLSDKNTVGFFDIGSKADIQLIGKE